jgi:hypothetical protein
MQRSNGGFNRSLKSPDGSHVDKLPLVRNRVRPDHRNSSAINIPHRGDNDRKNARE